MNERDAARDEKVIAYCEREKGLAGDYFNEVVAMAKHWRNEALRLREANREMHRRAQRAEAALPDWENLRNQWTPTNGSFGRALLAFSWTQACDELVRLREVLDELAEAHHAYAIEHFDDDKPYDRDTFPAWVKVYLASGADRQAPKPTSGKEV